jgi:hypothetical protein
MWEKFPYSKLNDLTSASRYAAAHRCGKRGL